MNSTQPQVSLDNINMEIFSIISDLAWKSLEDDPAYQEDLANFNTAMGVMTKTGKFSRETVSAVENAPWSIATPYGTAMFLLGLRLGRDPMSLLTLNLEEGGDTL